MTFENWWAENWSNPFAVEVLNEAVKELAERAYQAGCESVLSPEESKEKVLHTLAAVGKKSV